MDGEAYMIELLKELCLLDGVSSCEDEVRNYIVNRVTPIADEVKTDAIGNVMVFKKGKKRADKTIMLMAHMDEVGLMVKSITEEGYLKIANVGGIDARVLPGTRVKVGANKLAGIIGMKPIHLVSPEERTKTPKITSLYVDIGAADKASAKVELGDVCAFESPPLDFGNGFLKAKAIDDRIGCAVLIKLIEEVPACDCWFVFSVQEEVGTRGAFSATHIIKPDIALVVEGTTAADRPDMKPYQQVCAPGNGVVIPFMDGGTIYDRELFERLRDICESNSIKWQTKEFVSGGTDGGAIQRSLGGVKTAGIAAAVRYIHSPACVIKKDDADSMLELARLFLGSY